MTDQSENLPQDYLGKRQRVLNERVNEAVVKNVDFEDVRHTNEKSDVDKLFKIDLAVKYKQVDYIIEVLKSGDSFFTSRVINKCSWLYDEEHSNIISPDHLHHLFTFMSTKIRNKFLTAVSKNVRTESRAISFYHYCMENDLINIGFKFFLSISEPLKKELLQDQNHPHFKELVKKDITYMKHLIGNSFVLMEAYLNTLPGDKKYDFVEKCRHMYSVNGDNYLECLERSASRDYDSDSYDLQEHWQKFDVKFSRNIMLKHKRRILANPKFFVKRLDNETFTRYTTVDDAKVLAVACLPSSSSEFWDKFYYGKHKFFLKLIPLEDRYTFLKKIYHNRYPDDDFEMAPGFYAQDYHLLMTKEERQEWALQHLNSEVPIDCSIGKHYNWYEFVDFETSFEALKAIINETTAPYERSGVLGAMVKSASSNRELETVLIYYDEEINETRQYKDSFLHLVISDKNIFEFDGGCWAAFYKLLLSMELYNTTDLGSHNNIYKTVALLYHILYKKEINEGLTVFLSSNFCHRMINSGDFGHYNKLTDEKRLTIYDYLFNYYVGKVLECKDYLYTIELSSRLQRYFANISGLMRMFKKEVIKKEAVKKDGRNPKKVRAVNNSLSDRELLRRLKQDTELVVADELLNNVRTRFEKHPIRISNFLKKLKVYFSDGVAQVYLNIFRDIVSNDRNQKAVEAGIYAIFHLGDVKTKLDLMHQYTPQEISNESMDVKLTYTQRAVCNFAYISRPPVPLYSIQKYIQVFLKTNRRIMVRYFANLPEPQCLQLMEIIKYSKSK